MLRRLGPIVLSSLALGCPSPDRAPDAARSSDAAPDGAIDATTIPDAGLLPDAAVGCPVSGIADAAVGLDLGAFPADGHADAAYHVPDGFDPCSPHGLVVFFHGFRNCALNVLGAAPTECTPGAGTRSAFALSDQLDAAAVNSILVAVEVRYDEASGDPGALAETGRLHDLLAELYVEHLSPLLGRPTSIDDVSHVVLASHSGGYVALARSLTIGGVPIDEVELFDSLYGEIPTYESWIRDDLLRFDVTAPAPLRFAMVFTDGGGTDANSRALGDDIQAWLLAEGDQANLLFDDTTATLDDASYGVPILVKHSALSHDGVVSYYFERFVRASDLPRAP